jgi:hypothetical protein
MKCSTSVNTSQLNPHNSFPWRLRVLDSLLLSSDWLSYTKRTRLSLSLILRPTVSRPLYLGIKHASWVYDQIFITVRQLRVCCWGALSDEVTGLSFAIAAGRRQCSQSQVRVPWDSSYFTVSDSRLHVTSYDKQGYGGGIRPRLHTGITRLQTALCVVTSREPNRDHRLWGFQFCVFCVMLHSDDESSHSLAFESVSENANRMRGSVLICWELWAVK